MTNGTVRARFLYDMSNLIDEHPFVWDKLEGENPESLESLPGVEL